MKQIKIIAYIIATSSFGFFVLFYTQESIWYLLLGAVVLVGSIFAIISTMVYELYQKDKTIDYEAVKKNKLTLVTCGECGKENVLEDQYCIHCGEKLEDNNNV